MIRRQHCLNPDEDTLDLPSHFDASTNDWAKAALSTGFGFLLAVLLEPLKLWYADWTKVRKMEKRLYVELANNYATVVSTAAAFSGPKDNADVEYATTILRKTIRLERYDHAIESQDIFADVPNSGFIRATLNSCRALKEAEGKELIEKVVIFDMTVTDLVLNGNLRRALLLKSVNGGFRTLLKKRLKSAAESRKQEKKRLPRPPENTK